MANKRLIVGIVSVIVIITAVLGYVHIVKNNKNPIETGIMKKEEETKAIDEEVDTSKWNLNKVKIEYDTEGVPVPVPIGFTASKAEGEQKVKTGFVIYEGEVTAENPIAWTEEEAWQASLNKNQFVWVPVPNPSRIYEKNNTTGKIKAKLYDFTSSGRNAISNENTDGKREAGVLSGRYRDGESYDGINDMSDPSFGGMPGYSKDILYKELETEFKKTMESIEKYGGFYIGRYETGNISSNTPVVRRMNGSISNQNWYKMYVRMRNISKNPNIQTSMIWGCLWDETLQWLVDSGAKTYAEINSSKSWGNGYSSIFTYKNLGGYTVTKTKNSSVQIPTGSTEYTKANNIYDLAGNVSDGTLEDYNYDTIHGRYFRGGNHVSTVGSARRVYEIPGSSSASFGFRACLYVK